MAAIDHGARILDWQENLTDEEMPPVHIWHIPDELEFHFERVKEDRKERFGGSGSSDRDMDRNEYARGRR